MKILVIGSLNIDLIVKVKQFPQEGETLFGDDFQQLMGGKGANQASAACKQGIAVTMWGVVGNDTFGSYIKDNIQQFGITSHICTTNTSTGTALIEMNTQGQNRIIVIMGANADFDITMAHQNIQLLDEHDIIIMQFEIPLSTIEYLAQEAKKRGKIVIINPAPALPMNDQLLDNIDYLIPNEHELAVITHKPTNTIEQIQVAALFLQEKGIKNIITTLGKQGVYILTHTHNQFIDGHPLIPVDTTGAGDAFIGGFAGALARGFNMMDAVSHANKVAAISVTHLGAFGCAGSFDEALNL